MRSCGVESPTGRSPGSIPRSKGVYKEDEYHRRTSPDKRNLDYDSEIKIETHHHHVHYHHGDDYYGSPSSRKKDSPPKEKYNRSRERSYRDVRDFSESDNA